MADKRTLQEALKAKTREIQRGAPYQIGTAALAAPDLPEAAGALPEPLQDIARNYLGARRRSGAALLDAARWLHEARTQAKHGEWQLFLEATKTSEGTANRLLDIHAEAMSNPQFAEAIMRNWLQFTAAAVIAAKSTPAEVKQKLLNGPEPPSRDDVQRAKREAKSATVADLPPPERRGAQQPARQPVGAGRVPAPAIDAARTFATAERARMAQWTPQLLVRQAEYRAALDHIDALITIIEEGGEAPQH